MKLNSFQELKEKIARKHLLSPLDAKYLFGFPETLLSRQEEKPSNLESLGMVHDVAVAAAEASPSFVASIASV